MVNCFLLFCLDNRKVLSTDNPNYSNSEITSELGKMWKQLPDSQKEYYKQKAEIENRNKIKKTIDEKPYLFKFKVTKQQKAKRIMNTVKNQEQLMPPVRKVPVLPSIRPLLLLCNNRNPNGSLDTMTTN